MEDRMKKLHIGFAAAIALALSGAVTAADPRNNETRQDQPQQRDDQSRRDSPQERNNPARQAEQPYQAQPADSGGSLQARPDPGTAGTPPQYSAELKRCDRLEDAALKTQCLESVMKKFGQM
jgi:hypothetical protein